MRCSKCNTENTPVKKCCTKCGSILEGYCVNNITGKFGYRNANGSFTALADKDRKRDR